LFSPLDDIHRLRFAEIEEDEFVLWGLFASHMAANDTPRAAASAALDGLRDFDRWSEAARDAALGYYRAVLTKAAHREARAGAPPPWMLAKNPAFTYKVAALREAFPGARFVHLHRDPLEAIPSRLSLVRAIWRRRIPGFDEMTPAQVETVLRDSERTYRAGLENAAALGPEELVVIDYRALRADPAGEVRRTFDRLGLGRPDARLAARLDTLRPARPSEHHYALEGFGLTREGLAARLGEAAATPPDPGATRPSSR
ncbi:MAG: sulfotransferase, partial [Deltaproteobacteria bacterium]